MKNKQLKKALKSNTPINSLYALIPAGQRDAGGAAGQAPGARPVRAAPRTRSAPPLTRTRSPSPPAAWTGTGAGSACAAPRSSAPSSRR